MSLNVIVDLFYPRYIMEQSEGLQVGTHNLTNVTPTPMETRAIQSGPFHSRFPKTWV